MGGQEDGNGFIDADRLIKIIKEEFEMTIDIEKLIQDIDEDGSGEIEYDEFRNLLSSSDWEQTLFAVLTTRTLVVLVYLALSYSSICCKHPFCNVVLYGKYLLKALCSVNCSYYIVSTALIAHGLVYSIFLET